MDKDSVSLVFRISQTRLLNPLLLKVVPYIKQKPLYISDGCNTGAQSLSLRVVATTSWLITWVTSQQRCTKISQQSNWQMTDWAHPLNFLWTRLNWRDGLKHCVPGTNTLDLLLTVPHNDANNGQPENPICWLLEKERVNTAGKAVMIGIVPNDWVEPKLGSWGPYFPPFYFCPLLQTRLRAVGCRDM